MASVEPSGASRTTWHEIPPRRQKLVNLHQCGSIQMMHLVRGYGGSPQILDGWAVSLLTGIGLSLGRPS